MTTRPPDVAGTVRARNDDLTGTPEVVNTADPDGSTRVLQEIGHTADGGSPA